MTAKLAGIEVECLVDTGSHGRELPWTVSSPPSHLEFWPQLEPALDGRENVVVLTDVFTKFTVAISTRDQKAATVAKALIREWFMVYGVPQAPHRPGEIF